MKQDMDRFGYPLAPYMPLEEYAELFSEYYMFKREDGILEVLQHTNGDSPVVGGGFDRAMGDLPGFIGPDRENKVIIVGTAGEYNMGGIDPKCVAALAENMEKGIGSGLMGQYDLWVNANRRVSDWSYQFYVPTIGIIKKGRPSLHVMHCDIKLCTPDAKFGENHYKTAVVVGDGNFSWMRDSMGDAAANHMVYTAGEIDAEKALEIGLVSEIVPADKIMDRAWEIAREIMKQPEPIRKMTHELMRQRDLKKLAEDQTLHTSFEWWGSAICSVTNFDRLKNRMNDIKEAGGTLHE